MRIKIHVTQRMWNCITYWYRWHFEQRRRRRWRRWAKINRKYNECWHIFSMNQNHTNGMTLSFSQYISLPVSRSHAPMPFSFFLFSICVCFRQVFSLQCQPHNTHIPTFCSEVIFINKKNEQNNKQRPKWRINWINWTMFA